MKRRFWWLAVGCGSALLAAACILSPVEDLPSGRDGGQGNSSDPGYANDGSGGSLGLDPTDPAGDAGAAGAATTAGAGASGGPTTR